MKKMTVNPPVFFTSAFLLIAFLAFGVLKTKLARSLSGALLASVSLNFGWFYLVSVTFFIGFALWLMLGPYGHVRLGSDDDRPDYSTLTWFSMLFSAGMGIGLVFYGVAEPMMHYGSPPSGEGFSVKAAQNALPTTFFHWGVHAWAIYVVMAASIAYFSYRH
ncbi:MAG: BCCT family transporter, partial [Myxococcales bacterium]|nr:BCCT family transporter [Myxococcales bacterium]